MGIRLFTLSCSFCLLSCGGIAEYSQDDSRWERTPLDEGGIPHDPVEPSPHVPPVDVVHEDCSGSLGEAEVLFEDIGWVSQGLTPAANGLEFFYARLASDRSLDDSGTRLPTLRTRATLDSDFGEPVILTELSTVCEQVLSGASLSAIDLSHDGLRLYIGCSVFSSEPGATGPLLMVERASMGAAFELPPTIVGEVGISLGLTRDELTAYGTTLDPSIDEILWYKRSSVSDPFGPPEIAPGAIAMVNPEPSPHGQQLWGAIRIPETARSQLAVSHFNDATQSYDQPEPFSLVPPEGSSDFSPALTGDCRGLYFVRYSGGSGALSRIMVTRR